MQKNSRGNGRGNMGKGRKISGGRNMERERRSLEGKKKTEWRREKRMGSFQKKKHI